MYTELGGFGPAPAEMGLKHPEKVFDGRFQKLADAVRLLNGGEIVPREMEFPFGEVRTYEQMFMSDKQIEKAVKDEVKGICKQFRKGAEGFGKLTREKRSTFMALGAMVFPENYRLADDLFRVMRSIGMGKKDVPVNPDTTGENQEEELIFRKMPVVSAENCLLAAGLRLMAEEKYNAWGNTIVNTVAQLINWEGKEEDTKSGGLTEIEKDCLNYRSLVQHLRGAASGIDISLDLDKNWHMLAPGIAKQEKQAAGLGWERDEESDWWLSEDKGMFRFEENQLITEGVSPEDFIKIARAARPAAEEEPFHLISEEELRQKGEGGEKLQSVSDLLPQAQQEEAKEEDPDWLKEVREMQKEAQAEEKVPPAAKEESKMPVKKIDLTDFRL